MTRRPDFGSAVDTDSRTVRYVSMSQLTTFDATQYGGCPRAWYFEKVLGRKKPDTTATLVGGEVHGQIERYEKTGEDVLGDIARQGKHFIPKAGPGILIEHEFGGGSLYMPSWEPLVRRFYRHPVRSAEQSDMDYEEAQQNAVSAAHDRAYVEVFAHWRMVREALAKGEITKERADAWYRENIPSSALVSAGDVPFVGYIDVVNLRDHWLDNEGLAQPMPPDMKEVVDWKTSSNIEAYGKRHLEETVQMPGYGEWLRRNVPGVQRVRLSHGYMQTRGRAAEKRTVIIDLDMLARRWQHIEDQVARMTQVVRETDVAKIEANYDSCNAFGRLGCPHKDVCPRDDVDRAYLDFHVPAERLTMTPGEQSMSTLNFFKGLAAELSALPSSTQAAPPAAATTTGSTSAAGSTSQVAPPVSGAPIATVDPADVEVAKQKLLAAEAAARGQGSAPAVVPPDAPASAAPGNAVPVPAGTPLSPAVAQAAAQHAASGFPASVAGSANPPSLQSGSSGTPAELVGGSTPSDAKAEPKKRGRKAAAAPTDDELVLFVDCFVFMNEVQDLEPYVAELVKKLAERGQVRDIRLAEGDHAYAFGKWRAHLAAAVRENPPKGWCHIDVDGDEIKREVVNALRPLVGDRLVRGSAR